MGKLEKAGIPVYVLQGNHDAASVLTKSLPWPANVHRFGTRGPQTFRIEKLGVALHGWSFAQQSAPENLAQHYPDAVPHAFNIGVLHTSLSGHPRHDPYAPCELADLRARGYDYWALGHVHDFQKACEDPPVIFPGNLQGRNIREAGAKGAVMVEVHDRAVTRVERVELDVLRWARVSVDCGGCETVEAVHERVREALAKARTEAASDHGLIARVVMQGETALADLLADRSASLRDEARAIAAATSSELWLEKISVHTRRPQFNLPGALSGDIVAMLAGAEQDAGLASALAAELSTFLIASAGASPPEADELRYAAGTGEWAQVAAAAAASLRARLGTLG
ncbi:DNA repair exonuclease [Bradyrhizobium sp. NAS80.1]|uniref:metallophosphoesterase family protein n=1 Tax=Bradyrhizobium sp. NAS80.1 TaxID=1680159 RepID=UPI001AEF7F81|nr:DNA repair exonuclease [Bradyrhizobium sp. NAS80.1]